MLSISLSVVTKPRVTKFCARWEYWCNSRTYAITNLYVGRFINRSINIRHVWSADQISMTTDCTRRYRCILSVTCISVHRLPYKELVFLFTVCGTVFFSATTTWQYRTLMRSHSLYNADYPKSTYEVQCPEAIFVAFCSARVHWFASQPANKACFS